MEASGDLLLRGGKDGGAICAGNDGLSSFLGDRERRTARLDPLAFLSQFGLAFVGGFGGRSIDERAVSKEADDTDDETGGARVF